jgi:hypothetical protein
MIGQWRRRFSKQGAASPGRIPGFLETLHVAADLAHGIAHCLIDAELLSPLHHVLGGTLQECLHAAGLL